MEKESNRSDSTDPSVDISDYRQVLEELKAAKAAAQAANDAKTEFLASISHEILTSMSGIIGMISLLLDSPLTPEQAECLQMAKTSADSLLSLINHSLDVGRK